MYHDLFFIYFYSTTYKLVSRDKAALLETKSMKFRVRT